ILNDPGAGLDRQIDDGARFDLVTEPRQAGGYRQIAVDRQEGFAATSAAQQQRDLLAVDDALDQRAALQLRAHIPGEDEFQLAPGAAVAATPRLVGLGWGRAGTGGATGCMAPAFGPAVAEVYSADRGRVDVQALA